MFVYLFLGTLSSSLLSLVGKNIPSGKLCLNTPTLLMVISQRKKKDFSYSIPKRKAVVITHYTVYDFFTISPMGKQVLVNQGFEAFNSLSNHTW